MADPTAAGPMLPAPPNENQVQGPVRREVRDRPPLPDAQAICPVAVPGAAPPYDDDGGARRGIPGLPRPAYAGRVAGVAAPEPTAGDGKPGQADPEPADHGKPGQADPEPADHGKPGQADPEPADHGKPGQADPEPTADHGTAPPGPHPATPADDVGQTVPRLRPAGTAPGGEAWPSRFAQVLAETLAGARPPGQLAPWTTEQARRRISQLGPTLTAGQRPRVRRVIVTSPASGVLEMTVVMALGPQVRAVAVRLERPRAPGLPGDGPAAREPDRRTARMIRQNGWLCTAIEAA